jgi:hypothetical protein
MTLGRWVANLVANLLATAALGGRIHDIAQNYKMGDISKGVANTLYGPPKEYTKKFIYEEGFPTV